MQKFSKILTTFHIFFHNTFLRFKLIGLKKILMNRKLSKPNFIWLGLTPCCRGYQHMQWVRKNTFSQFYSQQLFRADFVSTRTKEC